MMRYMRLSEKTKDRSKTDKWNGCIHRKVIGRVKICSTIESLVKVGNGDILVASMTRPEIHRAMQKAAGL